MGVLTFKVETFLSCQAFNLTASARESLDNMLTESLKSRLPASSFQLFGIRQIEEHNMEACAYTLDLH